jgi:hypothetical protein
MHSRWTLGRRPNSPPRRKIAMSDADLVFRGNEVPRSR